MEYLKFFIILAVIVLIIKYFWNIVYYGGKTIKWIVLIFAGLLGYESGGFLGAFLSVAAVYIISALIIGWLGVKTIKFFTTSNSEDDYENQLYNPQYDNQPEDDRPINIHYHDNRQIDVHYYDNDDDFEEKNQTYSRNSYNQQTHHSQHDDQSTPTIVDADYYEIDDDTSY